MENGVLCCVQRKDVKSITVGIHQMCVIYSWFIASGSVYCIMLKVQGQSKVF